MTLLVEFQSAVYRNVQHLEAYITDVACVLNGMTSLSLVTCRAAPGGAGGGGIHETLRGFSFICECHQLHYCHAFSFVSYPTTGLDRPLGFQEVEASRISRQSAHEGGKVVSATHRPPLPPGKIPDTRFC
jgi:hypothetical protein